MKRNRSVKSKFMFFSLFALFSIILFAFSASTATAATLELEVEIGLNGQVTATGEIPVKFTITNRGEAIEGYLTLRHTGDSSQHVAISRELSIPEGSSQEIWLTIPGKTYFEQNNEIVFMTRDPVDGRAISFAGGKQFLEITPLDPRTLQVGVFAANRDAYNFLHLLGQDGHEIRVHALEADTFSVELLEQLSVLAINDYAGEQFTTDELTAIEAWLHRGGTLILSGGAGYTKASDPLLSLSPVRYIGTETVPSIEALEQATEQPLQIDTAVTLAHGELVNGQALLMENTLPLFAQTAVGKGNVLFVAYDVSLEPLASWSGNRVLWEQMLQDALAKANARSNQFQGNLFWELERALDYFPQLKSPSFGWMAFIFFIYILVVAPLLYFILKRIDKRGWAWFIIPSIALLFSVAIYIVGAWDRSDTLAQHLEFLELHGDGTGHRSAATSYFVPRGGAYTVRYDSTEKLTSFSNRSFNNEDLSGSIDELITDDGMRFYKVPFWSIRKAWLEDTELETYGDLTIELRTEESTIVGELTNDTNADLEHVFLVYHDTYQKVGSLAQGDTKTVRLSHLQRRSHYRNIGYDLFGPQSRSSDELRHMRSMAIALFQREMPAMSVIGFSSSQKPVQIDKEHVTANVTTLWFKAAELQFEHGGDIHIPLGSITPHVVSFDDKGSGQPYQIFDGQIEMGEGELELSYSLPQIEHAEYEKLEVHYQRIPNQVTLAIWNAAQSEWEQLNRQGTSATYSDAQEYIAQNNIRFKIVHTEGYNGFQFPDIMLEGRTSQ